MDRERYFMVTQFAERGAMSLYDELISSITVKGVYTKPMLSVFVSIAAIGVRVCRYTGCVFGEVNLDRRLQWAYQTAQAVRYLHHEGFVHRDLKPQNVLINKKWECMLTDFGISRSVVSRAGRSLTTQIGTVQFMPPEAFEGMRDPLHADTEAIEAHIAPLAGGSSPSHSSVDNSPSSTAVTYGTMYSDESDRWHAKASSRLESACAWDVYSFGSCTLMDFDPRLLPCDAKISSGTCDYAFWCASSPAGVMISAMFNRTEVPYPDQSEREVMIQVLTNRQRPSIPDVLSPAFGLLLRQTWIEVST